MPIQSICVLWTWRRLSTMCPLSRVMSCRKYQSHSCVPSSSDLTRMRVVSVAQSQCWAPPGLSLVPNSVCDLHGSDVKAQPGEESVQFWDLRSASLLFADDVVLFGLLGHDLQHALGWFAVECEVATMRVSASKSTPTVLCRKKTDCSVWVWGELLP